VSHCFPTRRSSDLLPLPAIMRIMKAETVHLNDIAMYYETEGAGEPLLLLHGGGLPGTLDPCRPRSVRAGIYAHQARCTRSRSIDQPAKYDYTSAVRAGHPAPP